MQREMSRIISNAKMMRLTARRGNGSSSTWKKFDARFLAAADDKMGGGGDDDTRPVGKFRTSPELGILSSHGMPQKQAMEMATKTMLKRPAISHKGSYETSRS